MANDENSFLHELKEDFLDGNVMALWRKLHGSQYQTGMPDLLVAIEDVAALIEGKWISKESLATKPFGAMLLDVLTEMQRVELMRLAALDGPLRARVVVGMEVEAGELPGSVATLGVGVDFEDAVKIVDQSLEGLASIALGGFLTGRWDPLPIGVEAHLRLRGQPWRAEPLLLGVKRYERRVRLPED